MILDDVPGREQMSVVNHWMTTTEGMELSVPSKLTTFLLHLLFQSVQIAVVSQQTSTRYNFHFVCQTCCSCCCCLQDHFNPRSGSQPTNSCTEQSQSFREQGGLQIRKIINF